MQQQKLISLAQFARLVGEQYRKTREASMPFHVAYIAADAEQQGEMRVEWLQAHLEGQGYSAEEAKVIREQSRTARSPQAGSAFSRAKSDFDYHVRRPSKVQAKSEPKVKLPAGAAAALCDHVLALGLTKVQIEELFKQALAMIE